MMNYSIFSWWLSNTRLMQRSHLRLERVGIKYIKNATKILCFCHQLANCTMQLPWRIHIGHRGLKYSYTYKIPYDLSLKAPKGQLTSKCYTGDELITISRNAQLFVNAYLFDGEFPFFQP